MHAIERALERKAEILAEPYGGVARIRKRRGVLGRRESRLGDLIGWRFQLAQKSEGACQECSFTGATDWNCANHRPSWSGDCHATPEIPVPTRCSTMMAM